MANGSNTIPKAFLWKKLHTITGLWLVFFLFQHLLTNSQAALFFGEDGKGFIRDVNRIHELPYLLVIEVVFLGLPFLLHGLWGIRYAWQARLNSFPSDGSRPYLGEYKENQGFTWQRITSWVLLVGIILHVFHMRIVEYPLFAQVGTQPSYMVRVTDDSGLASVAARLGVQLYDAQQIAAIRQEVAREKKDLPSPLAVQQQEQEQKWVAALEKRPLDPKERIAVANNFGTVELLIVRDSFKSPTLVILYSLFVLAASFHAFNGLWTAMISLGVTLTRRIQQVFRIVCCGLTLLVAFLGLVAIWGTYWINIPY